MGFSKGDLIKFSYKVLPPKVRGAAIVAGAAGLAKFARVAWSGGVKKAIPAGFKASKSAFKSIRKGAKIGKMTLSASKMAKIMNVIGLVDIAGDLLVNASIDDSLVSMIPGAGIVQLGAAVVNLAAGTNIMNAKFAWM